MPAASTMINRLVFLFVLALSAFAQLEEDFCRIPADCNEGEDEELCSDYNYCIRNYKELESYIMANDIILLNLTEGFFETGRDLAEFVTITYHYQIPNTTDEDNSTCFAQRSVYFWSTSPSFLLGPRPMFWLSMFAINPVLSEITLQLPCLQENIKDNLLSRLTYLIRIYAVTRYDIQDLKYPNKFYFKARVREEMSSSADSYDYVVAIWMCIAFLPLGTVPLAGVIGHKSISLAITKYNQTPSLVLNKYAIILLKISIAFMSPILSILFFAVHVVGMIRLHQYVSEIILDGTTDEGNSLHKRNSINDGYIVGVQCFFSFVPLIVAVLVLIRYIHERRKKNGIIKITLQALLIFNMIYLGYYLPYMIIAFVDNPLQTIFVYVLSLIAATFAPLILSFLTGFFMYWYKKGKGINFAYTFGFMGLSITGGYYLVCLIILFTVGGFHNFRDLRNLLWLVFGTLLTAMARHILKNETKKMTKDKDPMFY